MLERGIHSTMPSTLLHHQQSREYRAAPAAACAAHFARWRSARLSATACALSRGPALQNAVTASSMKPLKRPPFRMSVLANPSYV